MKRRKLRVSALLLSFAITATLASGCNKKPVDSNPDAGTGEPVATPSAITEIKLPISDKKVEYTYLVYENPTTPYKDTAIVLPELEKRTNVKINLQIQPVASFPEKVNVLVNSGDFPDMIGGLDYTKASGFGTSQEVTANLFDKLDLMPNFRKLMASVEDVKYVQQDAKSLYALPLQIPNENVPDGYYNMGLLARTDIMEKHNLKAPKTLDEYYNFLKELKKLYPDSHPLGSRQGLLGIVPMGAYRIQRMFNVGIYEYDNKKWVFQMDSEDFKKAIEFAAKLYKEKLVDQEYLLIKGDVWERNVITGKTLVTTDYLVRTDWATDAARKAGNAEYSLDAIAPVAKDANSKPIESRAAASLHLVVNKKAKDIDTLVKFLDYMLYSKDGSILTTHGIENVTYKKVGTDKIEYIVPADTTTDTLFKTKFGLTQSLLYGIRAEQYGILDSKENTSRFAKAGKVYKDYVVIPQPMPAFTEAEGEIFNSISEINTYMNEKLTKMIIGEVPISEWESIKKEARAKGAIDKAIEILNTKVKK